jgi:organic hydroperoxide reductase OsmC/OhrA
MGKEHQYSVTTIWKGNRGTGTSHYRAYGRDHEIYADGKSARVLGSSDAAFRGDPSRYNPEELLVGALSACHMLAFLHLCADAGVVVTDYLDNAAGVMVEDSDGGARFTRVTLHPRTVITDPSRIAETTGLHAKAHQLCFIARSVNFPVEHEALVVASPANSEIQGAAAR